MNDKTQVDLARTLWNQSRAATEQAHEAWNMVMKSQKTVMDSMRGAGMPFALAAEQFDKLMQFHAVQYSAALEFMDKMSEEYQKLLAQRKE